MQASPIFNHEYCWISCAWVLMLLGSLVAFESIAYNQAGGRACLQA